jgi:hypothetical protein
VAPARARAPGTCPGCRRAAMRARARAPRGCAGCAKFLPRGAPPARPRRPPALRRTRGCALSSQGLWRRGASAAGAASGSAPDAGSAGAAPSSALSGMATGLRALIRLCYVSGRVQGRRDPRPARVAGGPATGAGGVRPRRLGRDSFVGLCVAQVFVKLPENSLRAECSPGVGPVALAGACQRSAAPRDRGWRAPGAGAAVSRRVIPPASFARPQRGRGHAPPGVAPGGAACVPAGLTPRVGLQWGGGGGGRESPVRSSSTCHSNYFPCPFRTPCRAPHAAGRLAGPRRSLCGGGVGGWSLGAGH